MKRVVSRSQCSVRALLRGSRHTSTQAPNPKPESGSRTDRTWTDRNLFHEAKVDSTWLSPEDEQATSHVLRRAMRTLTHSVAVVTACRDSTSTTSSPPEHPIDPSQDNIELLSPYYRDFCGATISSLQTVTLGPPAIISFNLKMPSRTLSGLLHHGQFGVHLLSGMRDGSYIADAFMNPSHHEALRALTRRAVWVGLGLAHGETRISNPEKNIPLIRGRGVNTFMRCKVIPDKCVEVGDHMVVIAKVDSIGLPGRHFKNTHGLAYQHGAYGSRIAPLPGDRTNEPYQWPDGIAQILKNSLGQHNDVIGQARPIFETTLEEFCKKTKDKLPQAVQTMAAQAIRFNDSWQQKAMLLEAIRKCCDKHANSPDLPSLVKRGIVTRFDGNKEVIDYQHLWSLYQVGFPKTFWGQTSDKWPDANPPWSVPMDKKTQALLSRFNHSGTLPGQHVNPREHTVKPQGPNKMSTKTNESKQESLPAFGADPLGTTEEDEAGNLMGLSEEGYQNLLNMIKKSHGQPDSGKYASLEGEEAGSEATILEEIGSVETQASDDTESVMINTAIPPQQGDTTNKDSLS